MALTALVILQAVKRLNDIFYSPLDTSHFLFRSKNSCSPDNGFALMRCQSACAFGTIEEGSGIIASDVSAA